MLFLKFYSIFLNLFKSFFTLVWISFTALFLYLYYTILYAASPVFMHTFLIIFKSFKTRKISWASLLLYAEGSQIFQLFLKSHLIHFRSKWEQVGMSLAPKIKESCWTLISKSLIRSYNSIRTYIDQLILEALME